MQKASTRVDLRMDPTVKELAMRASALIGSKSLSEFVIQAIREKSARVIEEAEVIRLNSEAFNGFMAACEADANPNEALLAAQRRRKQRIDNGEIDRRAT